MKRLSLLLALIMVFSSFAYAAEYEYEGEQPGTDFYQATDEDYVSYNSDIVVGSDGTIGDGTGDNVSSSPYSAINVPVGEFPLVYGEETDIAIAQNSVFMNEAGPTSQTRSTYTPIYMPVSINSGSIPTAYDQGSTNMISYLNTIIYANGSDEDQKIAATVVAQTLPSIREDGATGRLTIDSIGMSEYVYEGTTQANMNKGIAHFECTSSWNGNVAFAGHNRGTNHVAFSTLKDVSIGDLVVYETAYGTRTYAVSEINTRETTDTTGLMQDGSNKITMYTCKAGEPNVKLEVVATLLTY